MEGLICSNKVDMKKNNYIYEISKVQRSALLDKELIFSSSFFALATESIKTGIRQVPGKVQIQQSVSRFGFNLGYFARPSVSVPSSAK